MTIDHPYHEGELAVQERLGEVDTGQRNGRAVADTILKGALKFIEQQPMAVLGSMDADQNVWASLMLGRPGFMSADERAVTFDLAQTLPQPHDPLWVNIESDKRLGALVIELASRRRLRINGPVTRTGTDQLRLDVEQSYPNCPKYIQRRHVKSGWAVRGSPPTDPRRGQALGEDQTALITAADTFFVASAHPGRGVDASHRGGRPGFVNVLSPTTLRVPDYVGNSMYNTLGNFTVHPKAGLLFPDFERGGVLQLIGRPEIRWELDDPADETGGTRRYWDFHIDRWLETTLAQPPAWEFLDYSPHNPA